MQGLSVILVVLLIIVVLLVVYLISTRNKLVVSRNRVKDQLSQIDVQLKRRFDLIPNLVETVKGYSKHEKDTLEGVVEARNKYLSANVPADQMKADGELTSALTKLFALAESYPELKSNENFKQLQSELSETEEKISSARSFYNDTVLKYNNLIELFPSNIVASMFGFTKEAFFEAAAEEKKNPEVKF